LAENADWLAAKFQWFLDLLHKRLPGQDISNGMCVQILLQVVPQQVAGHKMALKPLLMRKYKLIQYYTDLIHLLKLCFVFFLNAGLENITKLAIHLDHSAAGFYLPYTQCS